MPPDKPLTVEQHEPDWLDLKCSAVLNALDDLPTSDRILVVEQVLDYLRMDLANGNHNSSTSPS